MPGIDSINSPRRRKFPLSTAWLCASVAEGWRFESGSRYTWPVKSRDQVKPLMQTESHSNESHSPADAVRAERSDEGAQHSFEHPHRTGRRSRRVLLCALIAISVLVALRLAAIEGVFSVIRIDGGSMAESLCGDHLVVSCEDCGFAFRMDIATRGSDRRICPNCGYVNAPSDRDKFERGRYVMIDRWPSWTRHLSRGDLVAVMDPDHPNEKAVKRVVGWPNERIEVRDGDLYANGVLVRSSFPE